MVNNETLLGMYYASDTEQTYTTSYNTGESTRVYIAAAYITGSAWEYENNPKLAEYPKISMTINGNQKFAFDAIDLELGNLNNLYYDVPKNSTISFTVFTKHSGLYQQGVKLINFLMF